MDEDFSLPESRLADVPVGMMTARNRWMVFAAYYVEEVMAGREFGAITRSAERVGWKGHVASVRGSELMKKRHVRHYIEDQLSGARAVARAEQEQVRTRADEESVGEVAWIIRKLGMIVEEAPRAGQYGAAVSAIAILAKMHTIFRDGPVIDARQQTLMIPAGTTLEELKALRAGLNEG